MKNQIFKFIFTLSCTIIISGAGIANAAWDTVTPDEVADKAGTVGMATASRAIGGATATTMLGRQAALRSDSVYAKLGYTPVGPGGTTSTSNILRTPGSWGKAYGSWGDQDDMDNKLGYEYDLVGVMLGYDVQSHPNWLFGVNGGYSYADVDSGINTNTDINTINVGLYASYSKDQMYIDYGIMYSHGDIDNDRTGSVELSSDTDSDIITGYIETGYQFPSSNYVLTPFVGVAYSTLQIDKYAESPTVADAYIVDDTDDDFYSTTLGIKAEYFIDNVLHLKGRLTWNHEYSDDLETTIKAAPASTPTVYTKSKGIDIDDDRFGLGIGMKYQYSPEITFDLDYDLELAEDFDSHTGTIGMKYKF
jgi:outer membrane autotransporter protein